MEVSKRMWLETVSPLSIIIVISTMKKREIISLNEILAGTSQPVLCPDTFLCFALVCRRQSALFMVLLLHPSTLYTYFS